MVFGPLFGAMVLFKMVLVCSLGNFSGKICPPCMEGKERPKKESGTSLLGGGGFNKQENIYEACLQWHKVSRSLHLPAIILKIHTEASTEFSHLNHLDSFDNSLLS